MGIILDSKLNFQEHIDKIYCESSKKMYFIVRNTKNFKDTKCIRTLYMSLVRSKLSYGSQIWRPQYYNRIYFLSKIQNRVLRHLSFIDGNPLPRFSHDYSQISKKMKLPTLKSVMDVNDVKTLLKICSGKLECGQIAENLPWDTRNAQVNTRGAKLPFYLNVNSAKYLDNEPLYRMCKLVNMFFACNNLNNFEYLANLSEYLIDKNIKKTFFAF